MVSIPSRSRLLSTAFRRDLALKRYGRGANLVAMTGLPSKPPSRNISPMILSEAPLPYISAVSTRLTPSAMLTRKAPPTSLRSYSLHIPRAWSYPTPRHRHPEERLSAHPPDQLKARYAKRLLSYLRLDT